VDASEEESDELESSRAEALEEAREYVRRRGLWGEKQSLKIRAVSGDDKHSIGDCIPWEIQEHFLGQGSL